ncbi:kanadaptin-like [Lytechinus variegatus]|uniref:kanadaptin-like n=1 Tax=Lytechinus variegatus TaxID=7654 RepID=UPI001BB226B0|nr:kanadaptin-like [Lytechinus variegatus]
MAASMEESTQPSMMMEQNEEVSSSSDDLDSNRCMNAGEVSSSNTRPSGISRIINDEKSNEDEFSIEERLSAAATESSLDVSPKVAACVSSTDTDMPAETFDHDNPANATDNDSELKDEQGADSFSSFDRGVKAIDSKSGFKMPGMPDKNFFFLSPKPREKSSGNASGSAIINKETASPSSSEFTIPSSIQGQKKGTFAFALPNTLPKSKHGSFQAAQSKQNEPDKSPVLKIHDKKSEEKGKQAVNAPPLPYKEPSWSGIPSQEYHLEVLKNGTILSKITLNDKPFHVFGRLASCDIQMDHPSLSRYHMILQYRPTGDGEHDPGFYVYDLGSTHGSFLNKQQIKAKAYYRMNVGHMFKLGGSTRLFILQGPSGEQEEESGMSITELKELRERQMMQMEEKKRRKEEKEMEDMKAREKTSEGIDWGMGGDEDEENSDEENPFAVIETQEEREAAYIKDPKKTLRGFFEREDVELEYEVDEKGSGFNHQYVCRVQLPLDDSVGNPIYAEAAVSGKKKEAVVACALEACRILDAHGVLRQATHESKKRKAKDWAQDDYYDSDDDTFLDRTGAIEKKRKQRMKKAGILQEKAETYDSLLAKLAEVDAELVATEQQLEEAKKVQPTSGESDTLDDFIASLKAGGSSHDRAQRAKLKFKVVDLRKEQFKLQKLIQLARPTHIPEPPKFNCLPKGKTLSMIGSIKSKSNFKEKFQPKIQINAFKLKKEPEQEVEEEEEDEDNEDAGENTDAEIKNQKAQTKQVSLENRSDEIVAPTEGEDDSQSAQTQRMYGVTMPSSPSPSSKEMNSINKMDTATEKSVSPPKRVYGVAMPPSMTGEKSRDTVEEEEEDVVPVKSKRMYGPAMPPPSIQDTTEKRLVKGPSRGPSKAEYMEQYEGDGFSHQSVGGMLTSLRDNEGQKMEKEGEDYTDWQPPADQKGDGRTSLNEKLGY